MDKYIEELEDFNNTGTQRLIQTFDDVAGLIADDLREITNSKLNDDELDNKLQILGSKKNKIYERVLALSANVKHFKAIADLNSPTPTRSVTSKDKEPTEDEIEEKKNSNKNAFEMVSARVKNKLNGK